MNKKITVAPAMISSVYSGKLHKCCCGCAGTHTYTSDKPKCGPQMVARMNRLLESGEASEIEIQPTYIAVETRTRVYIVYTEGAEKTRMELRGY